MLIETIRGVSEALVHSTIGVNAQIPTVNVDAGDPTPPLIQYITDQTRDLSAALNKQPVDNGSPTITVGINDNVEMKSEVVSGVRNSEVSVIIQYEALGVLTHSAVRDAYYTMRAVEKCLYAFELNDYAALRTRNNVFIVNSTSMIHTPMETNDASTSVITSLIVRYAVRDEHPQGV